ncbi:MAG: endonuclease [Proteobacteria bacterium]|nr:MAG: endonuclease [Pseudomonadota bacterium]
MATHNDLGKFGEDRAAEFLMADGYEILERNWTSGKAEIDIIAAKNSVLAIVEVKTRSSLTFGLPQDFVNAKKIRMLTSAVNDYVLLNDIDLDVRFDIIAVSLVENNCIVEHLPDAFYYF